MDLLIAVIFFGSIIIVGRILHNREQQSLETEEGFRQALSRRHDGL